MLKLTLHLMTLTDYFLFVCMAHFGFFGVAQGTQRFGYEFFMGVKLLVEVRLCHNKSPEASKMQILVAYLDSMRSQVQIG